MAAIKLLVHLRYLRLRHSIGDLMRQTSEFCAVIGSNDTEGTTDNGQMRLSINQLLAVMCHVEGKTGIKHSSKANTFRHTQGNS